MSVLFGGDHGNNVTIGWLGDQRFLHLLLCSWNVHPANHSYAIRGVWRMQIWEKKVSCWDHLDWMCDWIQLRPLCKLWRFWLAGRETYSSCGPSRISLLCKLPCFLNPPPTSLGPSASFFGPFLPSECGAQFQISHGNSWANQQCYSLSYYFKEDMGSNQYLWIKGNTTLACKWSKRGKKKLLISLKPGKIPAVVLK